MFIKNQQYAGTVGYRSNSIAFANGNVKTSKAEHFEIFFPYFYAIFLSYTKHPTFTENALFPHHSAHQKSGKNRIIRLPCFQRKVALVRYP